MNRCIILGFSTLLLSGCLTLDQRYITNAVSIFKHNSVNRKTLDWKSFDKQVKFQIRQCENRTDAYNTIRFALSLLNDHHSFFFEPKEFDEIVKLSPCSGMNSFLIESDLAYLSPPSFIGDSISSLTVSITLQNIIREHFALGIRKFVLDLRGHQGGNMWPVFLGLQPLLGDGIHEYFIYPGSVLIPCKLSNNGAYLGRKLYINIPPSPAVSLYSTKIAVLIDRQTGSTGEAVALLFKDFPNASLIGQETAGLTSSNEEFVLYDGARLLLSTSRFAARDQKTIFNRICPDQYVDDDIYRQGIKWLRQ